MGLQLLTVLLPLSLFQGAFLETTLTHEPAVSDVLSKARPDVIPVTDADSKLEVEVFIALVNILGVDFATETVDIVVWQGLYWSNKALAWDPDDAAKNGVKKVTIAGEKLGLPDISCDNCVSKPELISPDLAIVSSDGDVAYEPLLRLKVSCPGVKNVDSADGVECLIDFESWTYPNSVLTLTASQDAFSLDHFAGTNYKVTDTSVTKSEAVYGDERFDDLSFNFRFVRSD